MPYICFGKKINKVQTQRLNQKKATRKTMKQNTFQWFIFSDSRLLLKKEKDGSYSVPQGTDIPDIATAYGKVHDVTLNNGQRIKATTVGEVIEENDSWLMVDLRASYDYLPVETYRAAGKAFQILYWDKHSRFCPVCGNGMEQQTDIMKKCPNCGNEMYPPVSTAIIVLIERGEEILLVRAKNFRGTFHGLVAGFLEAGETLEQCVEREVMEETGLKIKNIRYFASQPWPYPSGLMVGFTAEYAGGEIKLQADELTAGAFFSKNNLPELPRKLSIARRLIDHWLEK